MSSPSVPDLPPALALPLAPSAPCPCGKDATFGECCGPLLAQARTAATPEELMRSRYTAHVVRDSRHLHRTFLGTARQPYVEDQDPGHLQWTRLVVSGHGPGVRPDTGWVEFAAFFRDEQGDHVVHEKSEFQRIEGIWYYARTLRAGPPPVRAKNPAVGRNDPCPCGSGKKYKQCCLAAADKR